MRRGLVEETMTTHDMSGLEPWETTGETRRQEGQGRRVSLKGSTQGKILVALHGILRRESTLSGMLSIPLIAHVIRSTFLGCTPPF